MATVTASQLLHLRSATGVALSSSSSHGGKALPFTRVLFSPPKHLPHLSLNSSKKPYLLPKLRVLASTSTPPSSPKIPTSTSTPPSSPKSPTSTSTPPSSPKIPTLNRAIVDSTRTISGIFAAAFSISELLIRAMESVLSKIGSMTPNPSPEELAEIQALKESLVCSAGPLFFAAIDYGRRSRRVSTPVSLVAGAITKWLDIYGGILMVRVLLSWFPNIPWDRQPLSAIRDLCDPYLNLFRNIIPPVFNTLDISPFFAFMLLGVFSTLLNAARFGVH